MKIGYILESCDSPHYGQYLDWYRGDELDPDNLCSDLVELDCEVGKFRIYSIDTTGPGISSQEIKIFETKELAVKYCEAMISNSNRDALTYLIIVESDILESYSFDN